MFVVQSHSISPEWTSTNFPVSWLLCSHPQPTSLCFLPVQHGVTTRTFTFDVNMLQNPAKPTAENNIFSSTNHTSHSEEVQRHICRGTTKKVRSNVREWTMKIDKVSVCTHVWLPTHHEYRKPILLVSGPHPAALRAESRGRSALPKGVFCCLLLTGSAAPSSLFEGRCSVFHETTSPSQHQTASSPTNSTTTPPKCSRRS